MALESKNDDKNETTANKADAFNMPMLGLGTWKMKKNEIGATIETALSLGYRHIDTAKLYHNERQIGEALAKCIASGKVSRSSLFITSKLWNTDHDPKHVVPALSQQLRALRLQYLDLFLLHSPMAFRRDDAKPRNLFPAQPKRIKLSFSIEDTWRSLEEAVRRGLVRFIGVSNFNQAQIARILRVCTVRPSVVQCEGHPYLAQTPLIRFCKAQRIRFTAYSPLGSPDLLRKRGKDKERAAPLFDDKVAEIAQECSLRLKRSISCAQVLLRFHIERGVAVVAKATSKEHLKQNMDVFDWTLNDKQMQRLLALDKGWRCITMDRNKDHSEFPF